MKAPDSVCRTASSAKFLCSAFAARYVYFTSQRSQVSRPGRPPHKSNFYCHPGRAGGTPMLLASITYSVVELQLAKSPATPRLLQELSNCYCHPGRAGGTPLEDRSPGRRNVSGGGRLVRTTVVQVAVPLWRGEGHIDFCCCCRPGA